MTHLILFVPALAAFIVVGTLLLERRRPRPRTKADKQAVALLRSWLTLDQYKQWEARREFEVTGCDTGIRYRLTYKSVMNVLELDASGHAVATWCFGPEGILAIGDVLLAQKVALETMERKTLTKANRQMFKSQSRGRAGGVSSSDHDCPVVQALPKRTLAMCREGRGQGGL